MKKVGQTVKLRYTHWAGPLPERGDWLRTTTGRQYEILEIHGRQLVCMVLSSEAEPGFGVTRFSWYWTPRVRRG